MTPQEFLNYNAKHIERSEDLTFAVTVCSDCTTDDLLQLIEILKEAIEQGKEEAK